MVDNMTETLIISTEEKNQLVKMKDFRSNVGNKEDILANKTAALTRKNG